MFSIIIPLYNKAPYIGNAIRSVLNQTYQRFELIIVDDGSTDDPLPPKRGSQKLRFRDFGKLSDKITLIEQQNHGVSTARNNGVKAAKYNYIAFLDADDWWEPTYLEEMKALIDGYPEAGIYGSSYFKVKNDKYIPANIGVDEYFECGLINYCRVYANTMYQPLWTGATILKKTIFESEHGFKPRLKLGEDFDLWVRVAFKFPVALLNKPLSYYNQDVELTNRAVGLKMYLPQEHMLFTDYGEFHLNEDFQHLYEALAVYGLLPYYLAGRNNKDVKAVLSEIHWKNHAFKYRLYYKLLPKKLVRFWFKLINFIYKLKCKVLK